MHLTKSTLAVAALLGSIAFTHADYDTPAYVDLEFSEVRVNEPAGTVTINIIRTGDFRRTTTLDYQTVEDDASEGQDYKATGGTLVFKPGEGFKTITLEILKDDETEAPESFRFELTSSDPNCLLMRSSTQITIEDAPAQISQPKLQIASAGAGKILLSLDGNSTCALERSTSPIGGHWEKVECTPVVNGSRSEVVEPLGGKLYFYRLCTP